MDDKLPAKTVKFTSMYTIFVIIDFLLVCFKHNGIGYCEWRILMGKNFNK